MRFNINTPVIPISLLTMSFSPDSVNSSIDSILKLVSKSKGRWVSKDSVLILPLTFFSHDPKKKLKFPIRMISHRHDTVSPRIQFISL